MSRTRSSLHAAFVFAAGAALFTCTAFSADGVIREAEVKQVIAVMDKASDAHDWNKWGEHVASDCEIVIHTPADGAGMRTLRFSKTQYLALARKMDTILQNDSGHAKETSSPKVRLENEGRHAIATMTITEKGTAPNGKAFTVISTATTHLEYRGGQLQVVQLAVVEGPQS